MRRRSNISLSDREALDFHRNCYTSSSSSNNNNNININNNNNNNNKDNNTNSCRSMEVKLSIQLAFHLHGSKAIKSTPSFHQMTLLVRQTEQYNSKEERESVM